MPADEVRLLPDPEQRTLLTATLERVNRASNAARVAALERQVFGGPELRELVKRTVEQQKLPAALVTPIVERVEAALRRRAGKQTKFTTYQSLALGPGAHKWSSSDRVAIPTAAGRRTITVRVDPSRGDLRPPLEGRPVALVFRNGEFELHATDVERDED